MPVPKPHKNENQSDFIDRCMSDPNMQEYDQDQRLGVCFTQWRDRNKDGTMAYDGPCPTPNAGETQSDFMDRCMADPAMDAASSAEKLSACTISWNDNQKAAPEPKTRAYSIIEVKSINEEERIIEGIATTPATDRYDDIVEPMGAAFSLPMPLLWQHNPEQPVGLVDVANATSKGISFRATLPRITEPGILKDRIDEAWQTVKAGLVRGVSIGFKPISYEVIKDAEGKSTFGLRYTAWDWLELSLVTIPANTEATISAIRSFDNQNTRVRNSMVVTLKPGGAGNRSNPAPTSTVKPALKGNTTMPKPLNEQIADFIAVRGEKASRMQVVMDEAAEKGETLDAAKQEEFDGLQKEIETIDQHLTRLRMMEKLAQSSAKPAAGSTIDDGSNSRSGTVPATPIHSRRNTLPGIEFTRYAMCLMSARGNADAALKIAEARYPDEQRVHHVLRAAVAAGTTTDPNWAGALVQYTNFAGDFIDFLRPATIIGKFGTNGIPSLRAIPFNVRIKKQTTGGEAYWVGEGQPKPLTFFDFDTILLRWAKIANIAVLTAEQVRFSTPSAEQAVRSALADAIVAREDITFIDPSVTAIADTRPAAITNGATAHASSGTDANAARVDAGVLMTALATNFLPYSQAVWIMNSTTAISLFLMRNALGQPEFPGLLADGGTFMGRPVIVSDHISLTGSPGTSIMVLMIPQEVYLSDDGQVVVDASTEASLQMDSAPTMASTSGSPATPTATQVVSMFQTNSIAIRAERFINWARRRDAAVQYLTGVHYVA
jgi:HK97 family phage major capsid protein/HK97 family phage prohead protease